ncbi:hypothetical protein D3C85_1697720 [compost metagenome]
MITLLGPLPIVQITFLRVQPGIHTPLHNTVLKAFAVPLHLSRETFFGRPHPLADP